MGLSAIPSLRIFIASMSTIITVLFGFFLRLFVQSLSSERIFSALDIRPAGAGFLENAGWNYFVFTKTLV